MDPAKIFREGFEEFIPSDRPAGLEIRPILSEDELRPMMDLIVKDLSEPYSVFTYRYFVHNWPRLCWLAYEVGSPPGSPPAGAVVCKLSPHRGTPRGYLAMLAVAPTHRRRGLASCLVRCVLGVLARDGAHEVVLEAERVNKAALGLYAALGFAREKRLAKYYLNGGDAFRLKLWIAEDERNEEAEILDV